MRRLPPTGSLEAFLAAARAGSLRKASADLSLSVSALSRRVQKLEQHTGQILFTRSGKEFRLNSNGRRLFAEIEEPFDRISAAFERHGPTRKKKLTVGVPTSFATAWLIPRLESFRSEHQDVELRLDTSGSPIEKLGDSLDMIIFFAEDGSDRVNFEPLRPQGAFAVAREGVVDPLAGLKATLRETPILVHQHLPQILATWLQEMKIPKSFPLKVETFDDGPLLIAAAQSGLGMALVLEDMLNFYGGQSGLVRPFGEYVPTPFSYAIATKPASGSAQAIKLFRDWIIRESKHDSLLQLTLA